MNVRNIKEGMFVKLRGNKLKVLSTPSIIQDRWDEWAWVKCEIVEIQGEESDQNYVGYISDFNSDFLEPYEN